MKLTGNLQVPNLVGVIQLVWLERRAAHLRTILAREQLAQPNPAPAPSHASSGRRRGAACCPGCPIPARKGATRFIGGPANPAPRPRASSPVGLYV